LITEYSKNTYYGQDKQEEFRKNELKGELDPTIFYKNQQEGVVQNSESNRDVKGLKLEFDSYEKESERREQEHQQQIRNLDYSVDVSSRSSRQNDNGYDTRAQNYPSKEDSQNGI